MKKSKINQNLLWAIVLAAGRGKRMKAKEKNKVAMEVKGVPMIKRTMKLLRETGIEHILVVIGFAKESVIKLLDKDIKTVEQKKRLGTAHAVSVALKKIPKNVKYILVLNGDDSFLYNKNLLTELYNNHLDKKSDATVLTLEVENPFGLGRIKRDEKEKIVDILEEKDASLEEKKINEILTGCYLFSAGFLRKYIKKIKKSKVTGEYYLTKIFKAASGNLHKTGALKLKNFKWRGINTLDELRKAEEFL